MTSSHRWWPTMAAAIGSVICLSACGGVASASSGATSNADRTLSLTGFESFNSHMTVNWQSNAGTADPHQALQGLQYYDGTMTIDAGDSVTWTVRTGEPHTVTFLGPRPKPPSPFDPTDAMRFGGSSYDGSVYTSSGFGFAGQTYTLTFPKAGQYPYVCLLHGPGMHGVIVVQPAGSKYPKTQAFYNSDGASAAFADLQHAYDSLQIFPYPIGGTHLAAGISPAPGGGERSAEGTVLRFLDRHSATMPSTTIKLGSTVTWTNLSNNEVHTVSFAAVGHPIPPGPPYQPPAGGSTYDGSAYTNSGVMFPGASYTLKFTKKGTFQYVCLFHDNVGMVGTVVVQ